MRPYIAILVDSFREALASWILWILLAIITVFLLALAPLALETQLAWSLRRTDIADTDAIVATLAERSDAPQTPAGHIWSLLSSNVQEQVREAAKPESEGGAVVFMLTSELNRLLASESFYNAAAWEETDLSPEAEELLARDERELSDDQLRRRNRLLLEAAFPQAIRSAPKDALHLQYFGFSLGGELPISQAQAPRAIKAVLAGIMNVFVGTLGVMAAILVTASVVPQTFEPGAIDLLLSKPVSRTLVFLTKFVGGCAFILLSATYFIVGLWLIAGLRFDIWSERLLLCIPIFLFLFSIYYAVSALAGVLWRNAVVSVVMVVLFWGLCFSVGAAKGVIDEVFLHPARLVTLTPAEESVIAVNASGAMLQWRTESGQWEEILEPSEGRPPMASAPAGPAPVYDAAGDRLFAARPKEGPASWFGGAGRLVVARQSAGWEARESVDLPTGTTDLFLEDRGSVLAAGERGLFRLEGNPAAEQDRRREIFGFQLPLGGSGARFVEATPDSLDLPAGRPAFSQDAESGEIGVFGDGRLLILRRNDDNEYERAAQMSVKTEESGLLALAGDSLALALGDGRVQVFDANSLQTQFAVQPFGKTAPKQALASPGGRWLAVLYHNGRLWLYDTESGEERSGQLPSQGDISAAAFTAGDRLLLADDFQRVVEYELAPIRRTAAMAPPRDTLELIYHYVLRPIYLVFPKPGELDNLIAYLLTEEQTVSFGDSQGDLRQRQVELNVWQPVWSNLAFLAVMLGLGSLYVARKDF